MVRLNLTSNIDRSSRGYRSPFVVIGSDDTLAGVAMFFRLSAGAAQIA
jgi:hypothetical protein